MTEPTTPGELEAAINASFDSSEDGPQKAWFYVDGQNSPRVIYQTYAFKHGGPQPLETQIPELCAAMYTAFTAALHQHRLDGIPYGNKVYWRRRPVIEVVDGVTRLTMRIGIEGFSALGHDPSAE